MFQGTGCRSLTLLGIESAVRQPAPPQVPGGAPTSAGIVGCVEMSHRQEEAEEAEVAQGRRG